jgi:tripartite-type tricarboxylate transporter receptor subunit TctC
MNRVSFDAWAVALLLCLVIGAVTAADIKFPTRPVRIVVPFPAGGPSDILSRLMQPKLTDMWGQQVIVDNRPGAGTVIGTDVVAKAQPDGHTVVMIYNGHATNPSLHKSLPYDTLNDFSAVTLCTTLPLILAMHPAVPASSVKELVALAKSKPGQLAYATSGNGSTGHLAGEMFKSAAGVNLVHVPYKGSAPAITDVLGGQVAMTFDGLPAGLPYVKAGKLKGVALTDLARSPLLPEVPTIAESGYPHFEAVAWFGVVAPAKTPKAIIAKMNADMVKVLQMPDVRDKLIAMGYVPVGNTPEQYERFIRAEITKWAKVIKEAGIQVD